MNGNSRTMLEDALKYAASSLPVLTLNGKIPAIPKSEGGNGVHDATTDPEQIQKWWNKYPNANIGVAMGAGSGLWALDIDPDKGGEETLDQLLNEFGPLPDAPIQITGSGGRHMLFKLTDDEIANSVNQVGPGLDVRSTGGYIVVAPSLHPNTGEAYRWAANKSIFDIEPPEAPQWLVDKVKVTRSERVDRHLSADNDNKTLPTSPVSTTSYGQAALDSECENIRSAANGEQEATMNAAAFAIGQLVGGNLLARNIAETALLAAGMAMHNHDGRDPWTQSQIESKIQHGLDDGIKEPRQIPTVEYTSRDKVEAVPQQWSTDREQREQREQPRETKVDEVPIHPTEQGTTGTLEEAKITPPCFAVHTSWCRYRGEKLKPGVYYHGVKPKNDAEVQFIHTWICSPMQVIAITSDGNGSDFGRMLRFQDSYRNWRDWAMPMRLLKGSGEEMRAELLDQGVEIDPRVHKLLAQYIMGQHPKRRVLAASHIGWHKDAFVLPHCVIGDADVVFQSEITGNCDFSKAGTFEDWQHNIGRLCVGNSSLTTSISAAIAGPLLNLLSRQGGGLHWIGDSSTGKSTIAEASASVWGPPEFVRSWSATANGIEGAAAARNDCCLVLDEINEASPHEVGKITYMLVNGHGKQRAGRTGQARNIQRWKLMWISTGERSLTAVMGEIGRKPNAGQLVRLLAIPVAAKYGAFDELHGFEDGRAFADHLKQARTKYHGHLGPAFVERLVDENRDLSALLAPIIDKFGEQAFTSLEQRAASVFALIGFAGELAIDYELLPWPEGSALESAQVAFLKWKDAQGQPANEDQQIIANIEDFIDRFGDSRFSDLPASDQKRIVTDRAGWYRDDADGRTFMFQRPAFLEAGGGFDRNRISQAADRAGLIIKKDPDRYTAKVRTPAGNKNLYHIRLNEAH